MPKGGYMDARSQQDEVVARAVRDYINKAVPSIENSYNAIESHGIKSRRKEATHTKDMKALSHTIAEECRGGTGVLDLQLRVNALAKAFDDALTAYCDKKKVGLSEAIEAINKQPNKHHYIRMVGTLLRDVYEFTNGTRWPFEKIQDNNQRVTALMAQHISHKPLEEKGLFGASAKKVNSAYRDLSGLKTAAKEDIQGMLLAAGMGMTHGK